MDRLVEPGDDEQHGDYAARAMSTISSEPGAASTCSMRDA